MPGLRKVQLKIKGDKIWREFYVDFNLYEYREVINPHNFYPFNSSKIKNIKINKENNVNSKRNRCYC